MNALIENSVDVCLPSAQVIRERAKLIRKATPDILGEHYEMQNRLCDLCEQPIQDLILAELDHSVSVSWFAKSDLSIENAIAQANDPHNLRAAHASCNAAKNDMSREEWYARGLNDREAPRYFTDIELLEFQFRAGAGGRKAVESGHLARISVLGGLKVLESGQLASIRSSGGRVAGRQSVENGHLARIRELPQTKAGQSEGGRATNATTNGRKGNGGRISGRKSVERGTGIFAPGMAAAGGRIGGRISGRINGLKNVANGQLASIASMGGRVSGRKAVESGQLASLRTHEHQVAASRASNHKQNHINRNRPNPRCELCNFENLIVAFS